MIRGKKRKLGRKGSFYDLIYAGIVVFFFSMMVLIGYRIYAGIDDELQVNDAVSADGRAASNQIRSMFPGVLNNSSILLLAVMCVGTLALASLVRIHPIFILFFIVMLALLIFFCGVWSNVYEEVATQPDMAAYAADLTSIHVVMTYLPLIVGVIGSLLAIVMYKGWQGSGGL